MSMDRNVLARPRFTATGEPAGDDQPNPAEKLVKYFPTEAFALYAALEPLCGTVFEGSALKVSLWVSLALALVFCALFLERFWAIVLKRQIAISCAALVLYVAALGGPFATIDGYKVGYALILAVVASAFIVFVKAPTDPRG